jgi:hypothetical protein
LPAKASSSCSILGSLGRLVLSCSVGTISVAGSDFTEWLLF